MNDIKAFAIQLREGGIIELSPALHGGWYISLYGGGNAVGFLIHKDEVETLAHKLIGLIL